MVAAPPLLYLVFTELDPLSACVGATACGVRSRAVEFFGSGSSSEGAYSVTDVGRLSV